MIGEARSLLVLQTCSLAQGRVQADASCSKGYLCCDANCAAAVAQPTFQVTSSGLMLPSWKAVVRHCNGTSSVLLTENCAGLQSHCVPGCAENAIGLIFYRLVLTNMATLNLVDILMACMYRLLGMAVTFDPPSVSFLATSISARMADSFLHTWHSIQSLLAWLMGNIPPNLAFEVN